MSSIEIFVVFCKSRRGFYHQQKTHKRTSSSPNQPTYPAAIRRFLGSWDAGDEVEKDNGEAF